MSIKKTIPKNDAEAIEMLDLVTAYLKNSAKSGKGPISSARRINKPTVEKKDKNLMDIQPTNVIDLYASKGEVALLEHLNSLEVSELKKVISVYGLDKSRTSKDWKNKDKLVNLILERVVSVVSKGEAFRA